METDNAAECLVHLLRQLRIPVTRRSVYEELHKHPDHPSLLAFSDVLRGWGVPNGAYKVTAEELGTIPGPFLAHTATRGGEFRLIRRVGNGRIVGGPQAQGPTEFTPEEFGRIFTGHVLLAAHQPEAGEPDYRRHRRQERAEALRWPLVGLGGLAVALLALAHAAGWRAGGGHFAVLLAAKSAGLLLAGLLLVQSMGSHHPLLQRLCATGGKNRSCHALLASKAAQLTEEISWAEVGLVYFAGGWLALLVVGGSAGVLAVLALATLLSLPFTVYSLYYQARVARQWCVLCCAVQAVLWVEFLAGGSLLAKPLGGPSLPKWGTLAGCFLAPVVGWVFLKPYLVQARQAQGLRQRLRAFRHSQRLFQLLLAEQPRHELLPEGEAIWLGNRDARNVITVVSGPACPPCARTHQLLDQWLSQLPDLQVQVVFAVEATPQDMKTQVATHLLALNQQHPQVVRDALHDWYSAEQKDYTGWARRYPTAPEPAATEWLQKQQAWCQQAAVTATPTILLNGRALPPLYQLEDIRYFL